MVYQSNEVKCVLCDEGSRKSEKIKYIIDLEAIPEPCGASVELEGAGWHFFGNAQDAHVFDLDQVKPGGTVEYGKDPASQDDLFGPGHPTDELGLYGVADGDVALHCKRRDGQIHILMLILD